MCKTGRRAHCRSHRHRRERRSGRRRNGGARRKTSFLMHARGIEHHSHGVQNVLGAINIVLASGRIGREGCGYATITGQGNGRAGASTARNATNFPARATSATPSIAPTSPRCGASTPDEHARPRRRRLRNVPQDRSGRDPRAARASVSIPWSRCRTTTSSRRMLEKLEFYVAIDFFLNDTARYADIVLPGSLQEEDEGIVTTAEGRVIKINKAIDLPRRGARRTGGSFRTSPQRAGAGARIHVSRLRAKFSTSCAWRRKGGIADYSGITYEKIERQYGRVLALPAAKIIPARRGCSSRVRGIRSRKGTGRFIFPTAKRDSTWRRTRRPPKRIDAEYPMMLTTGRVVSQFLSGTQTRRIGPLVDQYPEPRVEMHPQLAEQTGHRRRRLGRQSNRGAAIARSAHGGQDDSSRHGFHSLPLGRRQERQPADNFGAGSDLEDSRVQSVRVRIRRRPWRRITPSLEPRNRRVCDAGF